MAVGLRSWIEALALDNGIVMPLLVSEPSRRLPTAGTLATGCLAIGYATTGTLTTG